MNREFAAPDESNEGLSCTLTGGSSAVEEALIFWLVLNSYLYVSWYHVFLFHPLGDGVLQDGRGSYKEKEDMGSGVVGSTPSCD